MVVIVGPVSFSFWVYWSGVSSPKGAPPCETASGVCCLQVGKKSLKDYRAWIRCILVRHTAWPDALQPRKIHETEKSKLGRQAVPVDPGGFITELLRGWRDGAMVQWQWRDCRESVASGSMTSPHRSFWTLILAKLFASWRGPIWRPQARRGWFESSQ